MGLNRFLDLLETKKAQAALTVLVAIATIATAYFAYRSSTPYPTVQPAQGFDYRLDVPCKTFGSILIPGIIYYEALITNNGSQANSLITVDIQTDILGNVSIEKDILITDREPSYEYGVRHIINANDGLQYPIAFTAGETKKLWITLGYSFLIDSSDIDKQGITLPEDMLIIKYVFANGRSPSQQIKFPTDQIPGIDVSNMRACETQ